MTDPISATFLLILTVCLPVSGECSDRVIAEYSAVSECLMDATALRGATQDDTVFFPVCMGVDHE
jgi:hypothetical protein